jgi:hypothetical protein
LRATQAFQLVNLIFLQLETIEGALIATGVGSRREPVMAGLDPAIHAFNTLK